MQQLGCESHSVTCVSCYVHVYGNKVIIIIIIIINYMSNVLNLQVITGKPDNMVNKPISRQRNAEESMRHV